MTLDPHRVRVLMWKGKVRVASICKRANAVLDSESEAV